MEAVLTTGEVKRAWKTGKNKGTSEQAQKPLFFLVYGLMGLFVDGLISLGFCWLFF